MYAALLTKYRRYPMQNKIITTKHMGIHFVTELCVHVDVGLVLFSLHTLVTEISNNNVHTAIFVNLL